MKKKENTEVRILFHMPRDRTYEYMQNQDKTEIILSIIQLLILYTSMSFYTCLKHANIPSHGGEFRGTKMPLLPPIFFSYVVCACFQIIYPSFLSKEPCTISGCPRAERIAFCTLRHRK